MTETTQVGVRCTVGQLAQLVDVTVRTLHHYDEIGLVVPSERSAAGYRLYTPADVTRLQHVVVYRRLGFALEEISLLLDADGDEVEQHLRRQRAAVNARLDEMRDLVLAIDRALEKTMSGVQLTKEEQKELFGEGFSEEYAAEAQKRWGDTDAWKQSHARTSSYTKADWVRIKEDGEAGTARFAELLARGVAAESPQAMDVAEQARQYISRWFYDCSHEMHRNLAEMYVADPRFTKTYEDVAPGLAQYVHDAIVANAARSGVAPA